LLTAWQKGGKKGPEPSYWQVQEMFKPKFTVSLKEVAGKHTIYFISKNMEAKKGQILVQINNIEFKQAI